jgi:hypothetical protein
MKRISEPKPTSQRPLKYQLIPTAEHHVMKASKGTEVKLSCIRNLGTERNEWSASRSGRITLPSAL